jgi:hypothetical protein
MELNAMQMKKLCPAAKSPMLAFRSKKKRLYFGKLKKETRTLAIKTFSVVNHHFNSELQQPTSMAGMYI